MFLEQESEVKVSNSGFYFRHIENRDILDSDSDSESGHRRPKRAKLDVNRSVESVPGIGKTYASRLKTMSIYTLKDLCDLYEEKCDRNESRFELELKEKAAMRADTIRKCVQIVEEYLT